MNASFAHAAGRDTPVLLERLLQRHFNTVPNEPERVLGSIKSCLGYIQRVGLVFQPQLAKLDKVLGILVSPVLFRLKLCGELRRADGFEGAVGNITLSRQPSKNVELQN